MFKTYLHTAIRSLWKNKAFTVLNVLGLSIGICAALVIYLMASWDFGFEREVPHHERIYRVVSNFKTPEQESYNSGINFPLMNAIPGNTTGVQEAAPLHTLPGNLKITVFGEKGTRKNFKDHDYFIYTSPSYFRILPHQWLLGSPETALRDPNQMVLTTSAADKFFPGISYHQLAGMKLALDDSIMVTVAGIVKTREDRTDFTFPGFISYSTLEKTSMHPDNWTEWRNTGDDAQLLVKLSEGSSATATGTKITALFRKNVPRDAGSSNDQFFTLQPLTGIHFDGRFSNFGHQMCSMSTLYSLFAIAGFLLLLGCINFINLTTAQSGTRSKEIGIRKTMGSTKQQLILQFMGETFILTFVSTLLSCLLTPIVLELFRDFIPEGLRFPATGNNSVWYFLAALVVMVSFLSGIYPAFVLAKAKPVQVLKNYIPDGNTQTRRAILRKSLTVSQFVVAQVFILATLLVSKQVSYTLNKDIGMRKDGIVYFGIPFQDTSKTKKNLLRAKILAIPGVENISIAGISPSSGSSARSPVGYNNGKEDMQITSEFRTGDSNYISVYQLQLIAGRNIRNSDTMTELLVNQAFIKMMGIKDPEEAVGKPLKIGSSVANVNIAGVVRDFNYRSLHAPIKPLVITNYCQHNYQIHMLLQPQQSNGIAWKSTMARVEAEFKSIYPDMDFYATFFDESLARAYNSERKTSRLLSWTAGLAVLISCLGLLGLVTFTTVQRTKEIGVRKVLGASVTQIVSLLSKDIIVLVVIALLIAVPIAWIGLHQWLQQFAYRTEISWWLFLLTGAVTILVALITLSLQTIRAALADPVKSLRTE